MERRLAGMLAAAVVGYSRLLRRMTLERGPISQPCAKNYSHRSWLGAMFAS